MSVMMQIARDVADKVSGVCVGNKTLDAALDVAPDFDLSRIKTRKVIVTPQSFTQSNVTRLESNAIAKINVCLIERIAVDQAESRVTIMETIASALDRQPLLFDGLPYAVITAVEFDPIYDAQLLRNSHVFISVCLATVKVIR